MSDLVSQAVERLRAAGVKLTRGLRDREITRIEESFGLTFGPEHRALLAAALPVGTPWVDWRKASRAEIQSRLDWPVDGAIFDVLNNGFWPASWGERPSDPIAAEGHAREHLALVPMVVPIYSHRYLPAGPAPVPSPVFSIYQTDVIFYGDNLLDYVAHEFNAPPLHPAGPDGRRHISFWSDLADGAESADL